LAEAEAAYREALRFDSKYAPALNLLAWQLATAGSKPGTGREAVETATQACVLTAWKNPGYIDTLAAALAATGDFDRAADREREALSFPEFEKREGSAARDRLELYRRKKAYNDPGLRRRELGPPPRLMRD
jgi:hypothetical protein